MIPISQTYKTLDDYFSRGMPYSNASEYSWGEIRTLSDHALEIAFQSVYLWYDDMTDELLRRASRKDEIFASDLLESLNSEDTHDLEPLYFRAAKILGIEIL